MLCERCNTNPFVFAFCGDKVCEVAYVGRTLLKKSGECGGECKTELAKNLLITGECAFNCFFSLPSLVSLFFSLRPLSMWAHFVLLKSEKKSRTILVLRTSCRSATKSGRSPFSLLYSRNKPPTPLYWSKFMPMKSRFFGLFIRNCPNLSRLTRTKRSPLCCSHREYSNGIVIAISPTAEKRVISTVRPLSLLF